MKKYFPSSELIINEDGSVFHLHVKPEWLADKVILVGDRQSRMLFWRKCHSILYRRL